LRLRGEVEQRYRSGNDVQNPLEAHVVSSRCGGRLFVGLAAGADAKQRH
jgi:hypothetical protein